MYLNRINNNDGYNKMAGNYKKKDEDENENEMKNKNKDILEIKSIINDNIFDSIID